MQYLFSINRDIDTEQRIAQLLFHFSYSTTTTTTQISRQRICSAVKSPFIQTSSRLFFPTLFLILGNLQVWPSRKREIPLYLSDFCRFIESPEKRTIKEIIEILNWRRERERRGWKSERVKTWWWLFFVFLREKNASTTLHNSSLSQTLSLYSFGYKRRRLAIALCSLTGRSRSRSIKSVLTGVPQQ